MNQEINMFFRI